MYHIRILLIMLLVALIGTASAAAALSTLSLERTIEVGFTNDSSQTAGIRIENTSEYDFMTEDEDGVVSFDLSKIITEAGNYDFNRQAEYTLANTDGSDVFVITNNTDIPVYIGLIEENISGLVIVGSEQILPGMASGYHFRLSTASDGIGLYDFLTAKLMISSEEIIDGNVLMGSNDLFVTSAVTYDFTEMTMEEFVEAGFIATDFTIDENGLQTIDLQSSFLIPLEYDEYIVTSVVELGELNPSSGGISIYIEGNQKYSFSTNMNYGYAVSLNRGYSPGGITTSAVNLLGTNEIINVSTVDINSSDLIPARYEDLEWWSSDRELSVKVTRLNEEMKLAEISIDGMLVESIEIQATTTELVTGMRTWAIPTKIKSFSIEEVQREVVQIEESNNYEQTLIYDFTTMTLDEFYAFDITVDNESGFTLTEIGYQSGYNYMHLPIGAAEYTVTTTAYLGDYNEIGGYGILVDANEDYTVGYNVQFDRGYGDGVILIHSADTNLYGKAPLEIIWNDDIEVMPSVDDDPEWWSEIHEISVTVEILTETTKLMTIRIDGSYVTEFEFESNLEDTYTGFRDWHVKGTLEQIELQF